MPRRIRRHVPTALCAAALVLAAPGAARAAVSPADAARAADRVRTTLAAAASSSAITTDQAAGYRGSLRAAMSVLRALDTPAKAARRDELGAQILALAAMARRGSLSAGLMPEAFRQLDANRIWFAAHPPPLDKARVFVAGDPLVYAEYAGNGLQLQPLFNWNQANADWFAKDYASMRTLVDALAAIAVPRPGGWLTWMYLWDYGGSRAPWTSGMAQAVALQAIARLGQAVGDPAYVSLAAQVLPGLETPLARGGLLDDSGGGAWWPLYTSLPSERVLNGDMQVVISLYDYAAIANDTAAQTLAATGAATALTALPGYDTGAWSMYDQSHEADLNYHDYMTTELGQLRVRTQNPDFKTYADRFRSYRVTPAVLTAAPPISPPVFYPDPADGFLDTASLPVSVDKISSLTLTVRDQDGAVVASQSLGLVPRGTHQVSWNGRSDGGFAPPGTYGYEVGAVDLAGNRTPPTPIGLVELVHDVTPPRVPLLRIGRAADGRMTLRWHALDDETPDVAITVAVGARHLTLRHLPLAGLRVLPLRAPRRGRTAYVRVADSSGNGIVLRRRR